MCIIKELNKDFRIDASCDASKESEIYELLKFSSIKIPNEYLELIRERTEIEINIQNKKYIRIWGANGCIEMNEAYFIQKYVPNSLAIGDDEDGNTIIYAEGKNGFGVYAVAFNDLDINEMIFISKSLKEILIFAKGIQTLIEL